MMEPSTFKKYDGGKPSFTIISGLARELGQVNAVMEYGKNKYGLDNWKNCKPEELKRYRDAAARHVMASYTETHDHESTMTHMAHLACNALFVLYLENEIRAQLDATAANHKPIGSVIARGLQQT